MAGIGCHKIIIALDINGTLLRRFHRYDKATYASIKGSEDAVVINNHLVYYRPYLKELSEFLESNNVDYVFWSTMQRHNLLSCVKSLESFGFRKYLECYDGSHCKTGKRKSEKIKAKNWLKDLRLLAELHKVSLKDCVLVDDDVFKSVEGCNFISVKEYDPRESDEELLKLIGKLREFISTA